MISLEIPVEIGAPSTGMAQAVLAELNEYLTELSFSGRQHVIDLNSLPMTDSDKRELALFLGRGEVAVTLQTMGDSQVFETGYIKLQTPLRIYSADNQLIAELVEITTLPEIIKSHPEDVQASAVELKKLIDSDETGETV